MIIRAAVTGSDFKNLCKYQFSHTYQYNHWCNGLETRHYATIKKITDWKICESDQNWQNSEQSFEQL